MLLEHPIDVLDVEGDVLRLAEELLGALDVLLNLLERRVRQIRQILGLVDEALRLVLKRADLVIDLLEGPRRRQDVLGVVGRVIDDTAEAGRKMTTALGKVSCPVLFFYSVPVPGSSSCTNGASEQTKSNACASEN